MLLCAVSVLTALPLSAFESMNLLKRKNITSMDNYKAASLT